MKRIAITLLALAALAPSTLAGNTDSGLWTSVGAEYKIDKKWSVAMESGYRSRNDFRTFDQWNISAEADYKPLKWLKLGVGYEFKYNNYHEKISYKGAGTYETWRPSYRGGAHRVFVAATGSVKFGRLGLSLRERYQYTYRPEQTAHQYDFDDEMWGHKTIAAKHKHTLRSRLKADYDIPRSKVDPYASVELYNSISLDKVRYTIGLDWKPRKAHAFTLYYRYQDVRLNSPSDPDLHILGLGYTFKF